MKRNEIYSNICTNHFLLAIPLFGNAKTTCLDKVAVLELKRDHAISSSGVWDYFDAVSEILENDFWKTFDETQDIVEQIKNYWKEVESFNQSHSPTPYQFKK